MVWGVRCFLFSKHFFHNKKLWNFSMCTRCRKERHLEKSSRLSDSNLMFKWSRKSGSLGNKKGFLFLLKKPNLLNKWNACVIFFLYLLLEQIITRKKKIKIGSNGKNGEKKSVLLSQSCLRIFICCFHTHTCVDRNSNSYFSSSSSSLAECLLFYIFETFEGAQKGKRGGEGRSFWENAISDSNSYTVECFAFHYEL